MKKIKLTRGRYAIVDDDDYKYLSRFSWHLVVDSAGNRSAAMTLRTRANPDVTVYMTSFLKSAKGFKVVTHRNRDSLDNRKENLCLVDYYVAQGRRNKQRKPCSSPYKGVYFSKTKGVWKARITVKGVHYDKQCQTEILCAEWYNQMAKKFYGDLAYQNET